MKKCLICSQKRHFNNNNHYPSIAPVGQAAAQLPQSMQVSASITNFPSPSEMAPTGHSPAQAPHDIQLSLITYAMTLPPYIFKVFIFYRI